MKLWPSSFRERNERMLLASLVLALLGYFIALGPTLELARERDQLAEQMQQAKEAPAAIAALEATLGQFQQLDTAYSSLSLQRDLLDLSSHLCKKYSLSLQKLDQLDPLFYEQAVVERYELQLSGAFHKQVQALKDLEDMLKGATISSVTYDLQEDKRNKKTLLVSYIHVQRVGEKKP